MYIIYVNLTLYVTHLIYCCKAKRNLKNKFLITNKAQSLLFININKKINYLVVLKMTA